MTKPKLPRIKLPTTHELCHRSYKLGHTNLNLLGTALTVFMTLFFPVAVMWGPTRSGKDEEGPH